MQWGVLDEIGGVDFCAAFDEKIQRLLLPPLGGVVQRGFLCVVSRVHGLPFVDPSSTGAARKGVGRDCHALKSLLQYGWQMAHKYAVNILRRKTTWKEI